MAAARADSDDASDLRRRSSAGIAGWKRGRPPSGSGMREKRLRAAGREDASSCHSDAIKGKVSLGTGVKNTGIDA